MSSASSSYSSPLANGNGSFPPKSSLQVTLLKSRSAKTGGLQTFMRPIKSRLIKIKEQPGGSLHLEPPTFVHEYCNVHERTVRDIHIYDINVRSGSTDRYVPYSETVRDGTTVKSVAGQASASTLSLRLQATASRLSLVNDTHSSSNDTSRSTKSRLDNSSSTPHRASLLSILSSTGTEPPTSNGSTSPIVHGSGSSTPPTDHNHFSPLTRGATDPQVRTKDWALHHDGERRKRPRQIYYFAGGSWQMPPSKEHWRLCVDLARQLTKRGTPTTVSLVSHPLAPHTSAHAAFPMLEQLYYELFPATATRAPTDQGDGDIAITPDAGDPEIILAGDSSGGNVALALTLHVLSLDVEAPAPASLMLISPAVDMRTDNPSLATLDKKDPVLSLSSVRQAHAAWCGDGVSESDPRVSPILADLTVLRDRKVHVNGVNAGFDLLSADVRRFLVRLEEDSVTGRWLDWEKQMHCFPLTFSYGLEEGRKGVEWIINTIDSPASRRMSG